MSSEQQKTMTTATLQQIRLTPLAPVLITKQVKTYSFQEYPGVAILRIDRSTFWVYDVKHQLGVIVAGWQVAVETLKQLAEEF